MPFIRPPGRRETTNRHRWHIPPAVLCCGVLMGKSNKGRAKVSARNAPHVNENQNGNRNGNGSNRRSGFLLFARTFLKYPNMVGWMLPSSSWVVDRVLGEVNWGQAQVIVEYGPGLGAFTGNLLARMRPDATLVALEINPIFTSFLKKQFTDPRLKLVERSATE